MLICLMYSTGNTPNHVLLVELSSEDIESIEAKINLATIKVKEM